MIERTIFEKIKESIKVYPVTVITGAKQVGKSTEVYKFAKDYKFHYISLDDIDESALAQNDPRYFIEKHGYPLIIDEVQYAPILMEIMEEIVNRKRLENGNANGMFILTGSQTFQLMRGVTQSMAGRAAVLKMEPPSKRELNGKKDEAFLPSEDKLKKAPYTMQSIKEVFTEIITGFYPEIYSNEFMTPDGSADQCESIIQIDRGQFSNN